MGILFGFPLFAAAARWRWHIDLPFPTLPIGSLGKQEVIRSLSVTSGLPVIQAQFRAAPLIGCEGGHFYV